VTRHRILAWVLAAAVAAGAAASVADGGPSRTRTDGAVPVLMYHVVADPPARAPFPELYVSGADFDAQMAWLERNGYHAVTLTAVYDYWFRQRPLPSRPVVVSFDDGYHSQLATAAPVLRRLGWPGVINLEVRNTRVSWGLRPPAVRRLIADGWELAAHTLTHPDLRFVSDTQLQDEVAGSRTALQRMFGVPVNFFCYPAGRYDDRVVAAVRAAGYLGATTTDEGLAVPTELFTLKRVRINRSDGESGLASKLRALAP
jgi:peptidoglycan/xylan/chitin deacetylase (PgdA/CDA1 family)